MIFAQPGWLWALAAFPLFIALFFQNERRGRHLVKKLVAARLQARLAGTVSVARRRLRFALLLLGLAAVVFALAQPRLGYTWQESKRKGRDILLAIDVSKSMLATDLTPSRLGRAKLAAHDFIGQLAGDRVGLIAFAGTTFLQAPLTVDYTAVLNALEELDTEIIPRGGTNIAAAIRAAHDAFGKGESEHRALVIFTDGEELEDDAVKAAEKEAETMRIFTIGMGSNDGSLIPLPGGRASDFVKDSSGQIVKSRLDEERLTKIAELTGGFYLHFVSGRAEIDRLVRDGLGQMSNQDIDARLSRQPIERYQWPLAAGLILLSASMLIGERRRMRAAASPALVILSLLLWVPGAAAKNNGVEAYERHDYTGALNQFSRQLQRQPHSPALHFNVGDAAYQQGDIDKALGAFSQALTSPDPQIREKAEYNLGNTLFQRGAMQKEREPKVQDWRNALQHYEQALKIEPKNADAAYNADVVRKLLEEAEKEPPKSDQKKDQQKQENKDQNKDDKQQQPSPGDKGDQEQKDGQQSADKQGEGKQEQDKAGQGDQNKKKEQGDKSDDQKQQDKEGDKKDGQPGEQPDQNPKQGEKKGDLKNAPQFGEDKDGQDGDQQEAEARAAAEGKMTEAQARSLLESLKGEDDRVQLLNPKDRKVRGRVLRDW